MLSSSLFVFIFCATAIADAREQKPHLLTFVFDDLGYADLGAYGAEYAVPFLDQMIREESVSLTKYYTYATCAPSRAALITGRYTHHIGMQLFGRDFCNLDIIPFDVPTVGESLKSVGYETSFIGKWHLGQATVENLAYGRGFDYFFGMNGGCLDNYDHTCFGLYDIWENDQVDQSPEYQGQFLNDMLTNKLIDWINTKDGNTPIHFNMNFYIPHGPIQMPPEEFAECDHVELEIRRTYCNMLNYLSKNLNRVVDVLKAKGIWDNALVVFTTDNGGSPVGGFDGLPHNYYSQGAGWNYPHRAGKATMMEGGNHNRAWITGGLVPEHLRGTSNDEMLHEIDIVHAQRVAAGVENVEDDGIDMFAVAFDGQAGRDMVILDLLPVGHPDAFSRSGILKGTWKYIDGPRTYPLYDGWYETAEGPPSVNGLFDCTAGCLFNLEDDPEERTNLINAHPEKTTEFRNLMAELRMPENGYVEPQVIKTDEYWDFCWAKSAALGYWAPALEDYNAAQQPTGMFASAECQEMKDRMAGSGEDAHTCGERMEWVKERIEFVLVDEGQEMDEETLLEKAYGVVHSEYPTICVCGGSDNVYDTSGGKGHYGGFCTCPDGQQYAVSDNGDACGSLACIGGTSSECNHYAAELSFGKVTCAGGDASGHSETGHSEDSHSEAATVVTEDQPVRRKKKKRRRDESSQMSYDVASQSNGVVSALAVIGGLSVIYYGATNVYKMLSTNDFTRIDETEC